MFLRLMRVGFLLGLAMATLCHSSHAQVVEAGAPDTHSSTSLIVADELVVATREVPPFSMLDADKQWEGISIDLLSQVKAELERRAGHAITISFRNMSLDEMLTAVEHHQVDLAAAAITVNVDREKRVDFTHPFYNSGLGIAVGAQQLRSGWSGILDAMISTTFARILAGLLLALLVAAVAIYFFERKENAEQFSGNWISGIASAMWWAAVTLTTVGYGDKVPKSVGGRFIGLIWMFAGLFIITGFTAAVTSTLTVTQLRSRIHGPADLARARVASVTGSTSAEYLKARHIVFAHYPNVRQALSSLVKGDCEAVVYDAPILKFEVFKYYSSEAYVLPAIFEKQSYAFALPSEARFANRSTKSCYEKRQPELG
ncbi:MAG: transporter substrate-binding domain-containing protein [Pirellulaceae bacterium]